MHTYIVGIYIRIHTHTHTHTHSLKRTHTHSYYSSLPVKDVNAFHLLPSNLAAEERKASSSSSALHPHAHQHHPTPTLKGVCVFVCICVYVCACVCVCVCMQPHTYMQPHRRGGAAYHLYISLNIPVELLDCRSAGYTRRLAFPPDEQLRYVVGPPSPLTASLRACGFLCT